MKDSFYTPPELAKQLVQYVHKRNPRVIADFCVGDGELLRAAEVRWKDADFVATDISDDALYKLKKKHSSWFIGKCDFQNPKSQINCKVLKGRLNKIDLILLNPPFSCIGGTRHQVHLNGDAYESSTALAFVVESLRYMSPNGCVYAILPSGVAFSERDKCLWNKLIQNYELKILVESSKRHFKGCTPNIIFVSLNSHANHCISMKPKVISTNITNIKVLRGKISMDSIPLNTKGKYPLVHTTNLHAYKIIEPHAKIKADASQVTGPAILLPRVGNPKKEKICILPLHQTVILSDCIISLKTKTLVRF